MVIKPLRPDVHLNKELFPVAVYFFFVYFVFCQPAATLTGEKGFEPSMTRETHLTIWDWISVTFFLFVAKFGIRVHLSANLSTSLELTSLL